MSTITANSSQYYQLSNPTTTSSSGTNVQSTPSLASALASSTGDSSGATSSDSAYLLDLSPEAQQYLSGNTSSQINPSLSGSSDTSGSDNFTLSTKQQQAIGAILAKYKDAPYTQDTFNQIQNDLQTAGLGASQLSQMDKSQSFNGTLLLLNYLNGNFSDSTGLGATDAQEQTKSGNYMKQIIGQWQAISTTATAQDTSTIAGTTA